MKWNFIIVIVYIIVIIGFIIVIIVAIIVIIIIKSPFEVKICSEPWPFYGTNFPQPFREHWLIGFLRVLNCLRDR